MLKKWMALYGGLMLALISPAQYLHLAVAGGFSNYLGDLQPKSFTLEQSKSAYSAALLYELSDQFHIRAGIMKAAVSANDKNGLNKDRNLSFFSDLMEGHLCLEYDVFNLYEYRYAPYAFAGVGVFSFNPYAVDASGNQVFLQPLGTEGQGFFRGRKKYSLTQLTVPVGGGIKVAINDDLIFRAELGLRILFTDYLDDVSSTYPDKAGLLLNNGQLAVDLSFRGDEVKPGQAFPAQGAKRGNPARNDYYYCGLVGLSYRLPISSGGGAGGRNNKYGCPVNIY